MERRLAAIRAAGEPLTLAELAPDPIPPEHNAATYLLRAAADVDAISSQLGDVFGTRHADLTDADLARIRDAFAAFPEVLPLLTQAAAAPDYHSPYDYSRGLFAFQNDLLRGRRSWRNRFRVLDTYVSLCLAEGQDAEALQTALTMLRLSRHAAREPGLASHATVGALRGMATANASRVLRAAPRRYRPRVAAGSMPNWRPSTRRQSCDTRYAPSGQRLLRCTATFLPNADGHSRATKPPSINYATST